MRTRVIAIKTNVLFFILINNKIFNYVSVHMRHIYTNVIRGNTIKYYLLYIIKNFINNNFFIINYFTPNYRNFKYENNF